jgi:hypothetical protein
MLTGIFSTLLLPETKGKTLEELSNEDQEGFVTGMISSFSFRCDPLKKFTRIHRCQRAARQQGGCPRFRGISLLEPPPCLYAWNFIYLLPFHAFHDTRPFSGYL